MYKTVEGLVPALPADKFLAAQNKDTRSDPADEQILWPVTQKKTTSITMGRAQPCAVTSNACWLSQDVPHRKHFRCSNFMVVYFWSHNYF